jgi:hypothetical protein
VAQQIIGEFQVLPLHREMETQGQVRAVVLQPIQMEQLLALVVMEFQVAVAGKVMERVAQQILAVLVVMV